MGFLRQLLELSLAHGEGEWSELLNKFRRGFCLTLIARYYERVRESIEPEAISSLTRTITRVSFLDVSHNPLSDLPSSVGSLRRIPDESLIQLLSLTAPHNQLDEEAMRQISSLRACVVIGGAF